MVSSTYISKQVIVGHIMEFDQIIMLVGHALVLEVSEREQKKFENVFCCCLLWVIKLSQEEAKHCLSITDIGGCYMQVATKKRQSKLCYYVSF